MTPLASMLNYLTPRDRSFWRWGKDPLSIEWVDGRTIAFKDEVAALLTCLAPGGLPPFAAVVLLLAACRDNWADGENARAILEPHATAESDRLTAAESAVSGVVLNRLAAELDAVCKHLDRVTALAVELRRDVRAKCVLAETVFETAQRPIAPQTAQAIVASFSEGFDPAALVGAWSGSASYRELAADLDALRAGLARVDAGRLAQRRATGLEQSIAPAEIDLPPAQRVRRLLTQLRADPMLGGVAQIARELLAAIHIPRALASPVELPVGGVSDLSNRGPLDRLLISELANDDLTLTTRIALNEALYLRREAPSSQPPRGRAILIDAGIRLWGVPRVFATAVALALAGSYDGGATLACFTSRDDDAIPVDLSTRTGIESHLATLDPSPHPGQSVKAMLELLGPADAASAEVMLVTHADAAADADFSRRLHDADPAREWHVATVGRDGAFRLDLVGRAGRRMLCQARLDLDRILSPARPPLARSASPLRLVEPVDPELPVILSLAAFPLLLPAQADPRRAVGTAKLGLFSIIGDRRLMHWSSASAGARQLATSTPRGIFMGIFADEAQDHVVIVTHESRPRAHVNVLVVRLADATQTEYEFHQPQPRCATYHAGTLYLAHDSGIHAIDPASGAHHFQSRPFAHRWHSGRFYRTHDGFAAAYFDGTGIVFQSVAKQAGAFIFDREGHGPWRLLSDGRFAGIDDQVVEPVPLLSPSHVHVRRTSQDGQRILIDPQHGAMRGSYVFDLNAPEPRKWQPVGGIYCQRRLVGDQFDLSERAGVNIRNRFHAIGVTVDGHLALSGTQVLALQLSTPGHLALGHAGRFRSPPTPFHRHPAPRGAHFRLHHARWADGSQAFLDSRGLLHLKSSDRALPEISLTLTSYLGGGWTSDGHTFGSQFFHPATPTIDCEYIVELLRQFTARLR